MAYNYLSKETYDICLKNLAKNKTPRLDQIPNILLKNMPQCFHNLLFLFFKQCYKQKQILASWKTNITILLYKKGDPSQLTNHRPIALANTIYKFFTSTITLILSEYGKEHQILHDSQEGFRLYGVHHRLSLSSLTHSSGCHSKAIMEECNPEGMEFL